MQIHIVLISDQILQNLIPLLMNRPARAFFVITPAMAQRGADRRLAEQLRDSGIEIVRFGDCPETGFPQIKAFADRVAEAALNASDTPEIILNATGGTKLMSLAFVEALRGIASQILYTDTPHRRIEYLATGNGRDAETLPEPTPMTHVLDVPAYLRAQGFRFQRAASDQPDWHTRAAPRKAACKFLGKHIASEHVQQFIGTMNYLANQALERLPGSREERLAAPEQALPKGPPRGLWHEAMTQLAAGGLLDWEAGASKFRFASAEAAAFIRGGWLEEYAYHSLRDAGIFDTRLGVEGAWDKQQTITNEFDALACHINQLLVIECKTQRFHQGQNDNEIAYKLDSLGDDVRGLFGSTWLLCAREPTEILIARARRAGIRLIPPAQLQHLRERVREWRG